MVVFNPEHPGQFGLEYHELPLVEYGLEYLMLGKTPTPATDDINDLIACMQPYSARYRELMGQENPTNPYIIAAQAVQAEVAKRYESNGIVNQQPYWLPINIAGAVIDSLPAGVTLCDERARTSDFPKTYRHELKEETNPVADKAIRQLLPFMQQTSISI